jgi:glutaminyl-tRNA synthetase
VLEHAIRTDLDKKAPRTMAVIDPIKVTLVNVEDDFSQEIETPLFPKNKEAGSRKITLTKHIYIDRSDFNEVDQPEFFKLTPNQEVGLKYGGIIKFVEAKYQPNSKVLTELICEYSNESKVTKGRIHWISQKDAQRVEVRLYDYLFTVDEPMALENPFDALNKNSMLVKDEALVNKQILANIKNLEHFQFERVGYFVVDSDTNASSQRYVFNLTVNL